MEGVLVRGTSTRAIVVMERQVGHVCQEEEARKRERKEKNKEKKKEDVDFFKFVKPSRMFEFIKILSEESCIHLLPQRSPKI